MAYEWSRSSEAKLADADAALQDLMDSVLDLQIIDLTIITTHRGRDEQNRAFIEGKSKLQWPESKHNSLPSKAVDVAPYISGVGIPWDDEGSFYLMVGVIKAVAAFRGIKIRCGADWDGDWLTEDQKFHDLVHIELIDE